MPNLRGGRQLHPPAVRPVPLEHPRIGETPDMYVAREWTDADFLASRCRSAVDVRAADDRLGVLRVQPEPDPASRPWTRTIRTYERRAPLQRRGLHGDEAVLGPVDDERLALTVQSTVTIRTTSASTARTTNRTEGDQHGDAVPGEAERHVCVAEGASMCLGQPADAAGAEPQDLLRWSAEWLPVGRHERGGTAQCSLTLVRQLHGLRLRHGA